MGATAQYSLDGENWTDITDTNGTTFTLDEGEYAQVFVRAYDDLGNISDIVAMGPITVDTTAPVDPIVDQANGQLEVELPADAKTATLTYIASGDSSDNPSTVEVERDAAGLWGPQFEVPSRFVWAAVRWPVQAATRCCGRDVRRVWRGDLKYRSA